MYQNQQQNPYGYYNTQPQNYYQRTSGIQSPQMLLKGRPVSSIEEVKAQPIDFDGSIFYFPDLANKRIYTKQINMDGTATLNMYEIREIPTVNETQPSVVSMNNYITRDEFDSVVAQLKAMLVPEQQPIQTEPPKQKIELNF